MKNYIFLSKISDDSLTFLHTTNHIEKRMKTFECQGNVVQNMQIEALVEVIYHHRQLLETYKGKVDMRLKLKGSSFILKSRFLKAAAF